MLKVRAGRRTNDHVLVLCRGPHAKESLRGEGEGTQVEGRTGNARDPLRVRAHEAHHRGNEILVGQVRDGQAIRRVVEARSVVAGAERPDRAVLVTVSLKPFEDLLAVMEHGRGRIQGKCTVRLDHLVVPTFFGSPRGVRLEIRVILAEEELVHLLFALFRRGRVRVLLTNELVSDGIGAGKRRSSGGLKGRGCVRRCHDSPFLSD